jgi:hypothetical protein
MAVSEAAMLTQAQLDQYHTFGFTILRRWFTPEEVSRLQLEARRELVHQYRHQPFDGTRRQFCCMNDDERCPTYAGLLQDPRFLEVADQVLGCRALPVWCDANRYVDPATGWHPDIFSSDEWGLRFAAVKFIHYLEPLTATTGALRVVAGSHRRPLHDGIRPYLDAHHPRVEEMPAVACETEPGDVIMFSTPLWHASVGGGRDRGLCAIAYYPDGSADDLEKLRAKLRWQIPQTRESMGWRGDVFSRAWLERAAIDPRRRQVVERMQSAGLIEALGADADAAEAALRASTALTA